MKAPATVPAVPVAASAERKVEPASPPGEGRCCLPGDALHRSEPPAYERIDFMDDNHDSQDGRTVVGLVALAIAMLFVLALVVFGRIGTTDLKDHLRTKQEQPR